LNFSNHYIKISERRSKEVKIKEKFYVDVTSEIQHIATQKKRIQEYAERLYKLYQDERKTPSFSYGDISDRSQ
jgi:hypothetical protein